MRSIFGFIVLIADVYALYHIISSSASTGKKIIWCLAVLILPVLGFIAWLIFGPRAASSTV